MLSRAIAEILVSENDKKLDKVIELLEYMKPYIEWNHNYTLGQLRLQKMSLLEPKNVITFYYKGTVPVSFYIPRASVDHIQTHYLMNETFWDQDTIEVLAPFVAGKHILDIGANVGNHSIFWGKLAGAASIQAFEPITETYDILERNVSLNNLSKIVKAHRIALGAESGSGDPVSIPSNRMQATVNSRKDGGGAIQIRTLDSYKLRNVHFAKIDVEGHTYAMLQGGLDTLRRCAPALYIELFPHEFDKCRDLLADNGYEVLGTIEDYNYVFVHGSKKQDNEQLRGLIKQA